MDANLVCSLCNFHSADHFCICTDLPVFCKDCKSTHTAKPDFHFALPILALNYVTPQNQFQFTPWLLNLTNSHRKLRGNLHKIDQCRNELESLFGNIERELLEIKAKYMQKLEKLKAILSLKIESSISETVENSYKSDYQPRSYLTNLIWTHSSYHCAGDLSVFSYSLNADLERVKEIVEVKIDTSVPELEGFNSERDEMRTIKTTFPSQNTENLALKLQEKPINDSQITNSSYSTIPILPKKPQKTRPKVEEKKTEIDSKAPLIVYIEASRAKICDLISVRSVGLVGTVREVDEGTQYIWVETGLYCSGSRCGDRKASYEVDREWRVKRLTDMTTGRCFHGQWWDSVRHQVFSFGGRSNPVFRPNRYHPPSQT